MNDEDIRKIIDDTDVYDEAREEPLLEMARDFYGVRMRWAVLRGFRGVVWVNGLLAIALMIVAALRFFRADQVKDEVMYAALFLVGWIWLVGAKGIGILALYRNSIAREIKRLEIRLLAAGDAGRPHGNQ